MKHKQKIRNWDNDTDDVAGLLQQTQSVSHCGPCSLSYCFWLWGASISQHTVARASGASTFTRYACGLNEYQLAKAAKAFGFRPSFLKRVNKDAGESFLKKLRDRLSRNLPSVLLIDDFSHWVALVGYIKETNRYVVADPIEDNIFDLYTPAQLLAAAWCENEESDESEDDEDSEPDQYFAILVDHKAKDRQPLIRITRSLVKLCEQGSGDTIPGMVSDLAEIADRSAGVAGSTKKSMPMAEALRQIEDLIVDNVDHWVAADVSRNELRQQFRDYVAAAEAADIQIARQQDASILVAQMTALLTTFAWNEEL